MFHITYSDHERKAFTEQLTVAEAARQLWPKIARKAVAACLNGKLMDTCTIISEDANLRIVTDSDAEGLAVVRHSFAHLLGHAVKQLYPDAQMAIGPIIEDGFYYDIHYSRPFTPEDLQNIEKHMVELKRKNYDVVREGVSRERALEVFRERDEYYKVEILKAIPEGEAIALYHHQEYTDMCRGPHVPNTRHLQAFKLTRLAGAYWRGDHRNEMLQRIYGTAWPSEKQLHDYLQRLEEGKKRDHRLLGRKMDLYHFQEEAPGMVFWHEKGWRLYRTIEKYLREKLDASGYLEVQTPQMLDRKLWERSGHWDKFGDVIFATKSEKRDYVIKPMNCPAHVQLFNRGLRSYRDLPYRIAEFGVVHRNEPSGTLHGLLRARCFTQDDAHIFCTDEQLQNEIAKLLAMTFTVYQDFGFSDFRVVLSTRPKNRDGSDQQWDMTEEALRKALTDYGLEIVENPGEGAFYGPKLEFILKDSLRREWQCGTVQLDFCMPGKLGASYVNQDGKHVVPAMIHRAVLGSIERFVGILIEHYAGDLPLWLAPVQAVVMNISDAQKAYAETVVAALAEKGILVEGDLRNEKLNFKIRENAMRHIPYMLVTGNREAETGCVAVRLRSGRSLGILTVDDLILRMSRDVRSKNYFPKEDCE